MNSVHKIYTWPLLEVPGYGVSLQRSPLRFWFLRKQNLYLTKQLRINIFQNDFLSSYLCLEQLAQKLEQRCHAWVSEFLSFSDRYTIIRNSLS